MFERRKNFWSSSAEIAAVAALYFVAAKGSLEFASINPSATPIWPPTGLALAAVMLRSYRTLPGIFIGAFVANATTAGGPIASAVIALGNSLEAFVAALLMSRWAQGINSFRVPSAIVKFAAIVGVVSSPISATFGIAALVSVDAAAWKDVPAIWATWWLGDVAGAVMITPAIVLWTRETQRLQVSVDSVALILVTIAVGAIALGPFLPAAQGRNALAFLTVLPLLWASLRGEPRDTSAVALILSGFAIWGASVGQGPFVQATLNASFLLVVSFIASVTLPSLVLSATVRSRDKALMRREEDYRRLIESVRDYAIFMLDPNGHVATWNSGAARIKQYTANEILGEHFSRFYTEDDRKGGEPERALASAADSGTYETEGWRLRRDGSQFWAQVVISAVRSDTGELIGFAKVTRDVTESRAAQAALKETRERLDQAQRLEALGQLTGSVAHDFNNVVSAVAAGVALIERSEDRAILPTILPEIRHALSRASELTRQLLDFARPEKPTPQVVDLGQLTHNLRGILQRVLGPGIRLRLSFPEDLWPVSIDPGQFEMALLNLVVNARDAMPTGGIVIITGENVEESEQADWIRVSVSDTGFGMTSEVLARSFETFFTTKERGKGTGLGLTQVRTFAEEAGGRAELQSAPGQGTTVSMLFPRA